jgi:chromosomal replication initiation ATPase DnaA
MADQLSFDLPGRTALGRDAFFVAPCNAMALAMIDGWPHWPQGKLVLTGPSGAGKTHLAHVWAQLTGARIMDARSLATADIPELARTPLAIEDVPHIAEDNASETALFHLHNLMLSEGHPLLMTGTATVAEWSLTLPDLISRLRGTTSVAVEPPDDRLLSALLVKLFADRQMTPKPNLIPYLLARMDRSFVAAIEVVERLDSSSMAQKRPVTRALAAEILDRPA